jgi:hypothetical protein
MVVYFAHFFILTGFNVCGEQDVFRCDSQISIPGLCWLGQRRIFLVCSFLQLYLGSLADARNFCHPFFPRNIRKSDATGGGNDPSQQPNPSFRSFRIQQVYYLSTFYKRNELASRVGVFYAAASIAGAFSGLIAYGCPLRMHISS